MTLNKIEERNNADVYYLCST